MRTYRIVSFVLLAGLIFTIGCTGPLKEPLKVCQGGMSVEQALQKLKQQRENMLSFKAEGQCRLTYYNDGKKNNENLQVTILIRSPFEIYLQGNISVVPKAVVAGANKDEFWLALRPNEISSYWSGQWSQLDSTQNLLLNPRMLLEAIGVVDVDLQANWSLTNEGPFDILTKKENGIIMRKIYIYCCDGSVRKIEFFNTAGQITTIAEMSEYEAVSENFSIPGKLDITRPSEHKEDVVSISFKLDSVKAQKMTEKQDAFFKPVSAKGFKNIWRLNNGQWTKESK
jgi:hypothetical protein